MSRPVSVKIEGYPRCPRCLTAPLNGATCISTFGATPTTGDCSVCWYCGAINTFVDTARGMTMRPPTDDEMALFEADEEVMAARRGILLMRQAERREQS